ncbi:MAG: hypothetical protein JWO60_816, partial [Frankiales bacterium]|nr:hypothetical protein [Frankiales bacterium]
VAQDERAKTSDSPGAEPAVTPGLEPGGGVQPGDTPPSADSMSGAVGDDRKNTPNMGPVSGNRTPMIITLVIIGLFVLLVLAYGVAQITSYLNKSPGGDQTSLGTTVVQLR